MTKIIVYYNICGLGTKENVDYYCQSIQSILDQDYLDFKVVVSSCLNSSSVIHRLSQEFDKKILINWIKEKLPINVTFNKSVIEVIKRFRKPEIGHLYIDSGCSFENQSNILTEIEKILSSFEVGLLSIRTDTNTGFPVWLGIGSHDNDSDAFNKYFRGLTNHYIVPVGKAINLHCQLYTTHLVDFYDKAIPDIWAGEAHESVYSFLTAALGTKWIIHKDIEIHHETSLDGPSSGFAPWQFVQSTGRPPWDHGFIRNSIWDSVKDGYQYGLGYEEITPVLKHDPRKFDANGYATDPRLKEYIKNNLFLTEKEFDYSKVKSEWIE